MVNDNNNHQDNMNLGRPFLPGVWAFQVGPGKKVLIWHQIREGRYQGLRNQLLDVLIIQGRGHEVLNKNCSNSKAKEGQMGNTVKKGSQCKLGKISDVEMEKEKRIQR